MTKYLLLNITVMAVIGLLGTRLSWKDLKTKRLLIVISALLAMTAVFDSLIVGLNLVDYDLSTILGIYVGKAPIEDFCYTLTAAVLVPLLWENGVSHDKK